MIQWKKLVGEEGAVQLAANAPFIMMGLQAGRPTPLGGPDGNILITQYLYCKVLEFDESSKELLVSYRPPMGDVDCKLRLDADSVQYFVQGTSIIRAVIMPGSPPPS